MIDWEDVDFVEEASVVRSLPPLGFSVKWIAFRGLKGTGSIERCAWSPIVPSNTVPSLSCSPDDAAHSPARLGAAFLWADFHVREEQQRHEAGKQSSGSSDESIETLSASNIAANPRATMATPPINVTPASPDTNASGITNRRLSYQPADAAGPQHRHRSSVQYSVGGTPASGYAPSHLRTGSVPYVPDAPAR